MFVSWRDGNGEVYVMNADGSAPENLTRHPANDCHPAWSPDGRRIAFVSRRDGNSEIYVMNADGSGKRTSRGVERATLTFSSEIDSPRLVTRRRRIAFLPRHAQLQVPRRGVIRRDGNDLYVVNADGSGLRNLTRNQRPTSPYSQLVWSPDGRTIYFGRYLVRTDGSGARRLPYIPTTAVWSPDGRRIAFAAGGAA